MGVVAEIVREGEGELLFRINTGVGWIIHLDPLAAEELRMAIVEYLKEVRNASTNAPQTPDR